MSDERFAVISIRHSLLGYLTPPTPGFDTSYPGTAKAGRPPDLDDGPNSVNKTATHGQTGRQKLLTVIDPYRYQPQTGTPTLVRDWGWWGLTATTP